MFSIFANPEVRSRELSCLTRKLMTTTMAASCSLVCCGEERDSDKAVIGDFLSFFVCHNILEEHCNCNSACKCRVVVLFSILNSHKYRTRGC